MRLLAETLTCALVLLVALGPRAVSRVVDRSWSGLSLWQSVGVKPAECGVRTRLWAALRVGQAVLEHLAARVEVRV